MSGKLVRDKIPQIIKHQGKIAETRVLDKQEYQEELLKKLCEEVEEFKQDRNQEELVDILEVIDAIYDFFGFDKGEVDKIKQQKLEQRGGFKDRIYLIKN